MTASHKHQVYGRPPAPYNVKAFEITPQYQPMAEVLRSCPKTPAPNPPIINRRASSKQVGMTWL